MRLRGTYRLNRWFRQATTPLRSQVAILLYHRVCEAETDPFLLCVSPKHFAEQLEHLRRDYRVLTLRELTNSLRDRRLPKRAVVITFDDGYVDNLRNARPLLERYNVPATVFVATGYVGQEREFWWDELERLTLLAPVLPDRLQVTVNNRAYVWNMGEWARVSRRGKVFDPAWDMFSGEDTTPRHRAYRELHALLLPLGDDQQREVLENLRAQAGMNGNIRSDYRALRADEIRRLAEGGLVEIGAHTVTHPWLAAHPADVQRSELRQSKQALEELLGEPVVTLAYPYGGRSTADQTTTRLAEEVGFKAACSTVSKPVTRQDNLFWLPRLTVCNWDGDEFARRVQRFFTYGVSDP